ncbi:uncharacterized protein JN550_000580 [Neoarthrinium moseri]|uniref:uncharacterized protein n=1 Tax=Neoarthrinium moseri TaxID=1658444 RepID=UPI001FDDD818|nr:uncharacterized protein JN550_000580 [Neoarthrinium moseri]KAI1878398.1 hypothetical protein JN550_000580 [Neoarthrinium moseri]
MKKWNAKKKEFTNRLDGQWREKASSIKRWSFDIVKPDRRRTYQQRNNSANVPPKSPKFQKSPRPRISSTEADTERRHDEQKEQRYGKLVLKELNQSTQALIPPGQKGTWPIVSRKDNPGKDRVFIPIATPGREHLESNKSGGNAMSGVRPSRSIDSDNHEGDLKALATSGTSKQSNGNWPEVTQNLARRNMARLDRFRQTSKLSEESIKILDIYEDKLRLDIKGILDQEKVQGGFSLTIRRGKMAGYWIIDIMTESTLNSTIVDKLDSAKNACLPPTTRDKVEFDLRGGEVELSCDSSIDTSSQVDDQFDNPINIFKYNDMHFGDSVGPPWRNASATLGPMVEINATPYWLLNWHTFDDEQARGTSSWDQSRPPSIIAVHPSPDDMAAGSANEEEGIEVGHAVAYSGQMYTTTRLSECPASDGRVKRVRVVTDWVLIKAKTLAKVNKVRDITLPERCDSFARTIKETGDPERQGDNFVYSVGRSSGLTYGRLGPVLADVRHKNGCETREWYVENITDLEGWRKGGMGIPGDSGAGIIDAQSHKLLGQLWGRNKYAGNPSEPRVAYFTKISTVFDDIQERFHEARDFRPRLPQETPASPTDADGLGSIHESAEAGLGTSSMETNEPNTSHPFNWERRSNARGILLSQRCGALVVVARHAKTWPMAVSAGVVVH